MQKYSKYIVIIWIVALIAVVIGSLNSTTAPTDKYHIDKIIHFAAFSFLSFLLPLFIKNTKILVICLILIITVGGSIEVMQSYIPNRQGSWEDFIADLSGVIIGVLVSLFFKKIRKSRY